MKFFEVKRVHFNIDTIHKDDTDMSNFFEKIYNLLNSKTLSP